MERENQVIRRLRRRISRLTRQNERLRRRCGIAWEDGNPAPEIALHSREGRLIMSCSGYPRYLLSMLRQSTAYRGWMRLLTYFRRFRLVSVIIRVATSLVTVIETSALLIVAATVFIVTLPLLLAASLITAVAVVISGSRCNRRLAPLMLDKQIFVFFPTSSPRCGGVLDATVRHLASDPANAVFAVSPHFISSELFGQQEPYFIQRQAAENVFYVRKYYFFMLRRGVLSHADHPVRYIF